MSDAETARWPPLAELAPRHGHAWLVGGAVRDDLLGRATPDFDLAVDGDARGAGAGARPRGRRPRLPALGCVRRLARARARAGLAGRSDAADGGDARAGPAPPRPHDQRDRPRARCAGRRADRPAAVASRDLAGAAPAQRRAASRSAPIRCGCCGSRAWPPSSASRPSPRPWRLAAAAAPALIEVAAERVFAELRLIARARPRRRRPRAGAASSARPPSVLPELRRAARASSRAITTTSTSTTTRSRRCGRRSSSSATRRRRSASSAPSWRAVLAEPLANELTRGEALRFGALLHDIAKPRTRAVTRRRAASRSSSHDARGAELAAEILGRLRASERLTTHVAALDAPPPAARASSSTSGRSRAARVYRYLGSLRAGRGRRHRAERRRPAGDAAGATPSAPSRCTSSSRGRCSPTRCAGERERPRPPVAGDELARALGIEPGPQLGRLLAELTEAAYAGEIETDEALLAHARDWLAQRLGRRGAPSAGDARRLPGMAEDCIFCKIVAGEIPAQIVEEDEQTLAFMDIAPATRGHVLVIPKRHAARPLGDRARRAGGRRRDRAAAGAAGARAARRRRRQPDQLLPAGGLADGLPLPHARDPALRRRSAEAAVGARARASYGRDRLREELRRRQLADGRPSPTDIC